MDARYLIESELMDSFRIHAGSGLLLDQKSI